MLTQTVFWVEAQALASLNIAQAHRSLRNSTKSKYTYESAQETLGPIKRSFTRMRACVVMNERLLLERTVLYF